MTGGTGAMGIASVGTGTVAAGTGATVGWTVTADDRSDDRWDYRSRLRDRRDTRGEREAEAVPGEFRHGGSSERGHERGAGHCVHRSPGPPT